MNGCKQDTAGKADFQFFLNEVHQPVLEFVSAIVWMYGRGIHVNDFQKFFLGKIQFIAVIVRMQAGEELDLSGVYESFSAIQTEEINGVKVTVQQTDTSFLHLIYKDGYSYSIYAPDGYPEDTSQDFLTFFS